MTYNPVSRNDLKGETIMTQAVLRTKDITPKAVIEQALTQPGTIAGCYSLFRDYSINNTIAFAMQLKAHGRAIAPVKAGKQWVKGGFITEEERLKHKKEMLWGLLPVFNEYTVKDENGKPKLDENGEPKKLQSLAYFKTVQAWYASSQLPIEVKQEVETDFNEQEVLDRLGLTMIEWNTIDGNAQGYAIPNKKEIAINPLCTKRVDTFIHEVAHCLLHSNEDKIVDGVELDRSTKEVEAELTSYLVMVMIGIENETILSNARGYIQGWLNRGEHEFKNYGRVYKAANTIMKAIANHKGKYQATKADFQKSTEQTDYKGE